MFAETNTKDYARLVQSQCNATVLEYKGPEYREVFDSLEHLRISVQPTSIHITSYFLFVKCIFVSFKPSSQEPTLLREHYLSLSHNAFLSRYHPCFHLRQQLWMSTPETPTPKISMHETLTTVTYMPVIPKQVTFALETHVSIPSAVVT